MHIIILLSRLEHICVVQGWNVHLGASRDTSQLRTSRSRGTEGSDGSCRQLLATFGPDSNGFEKRSIKKYMI